MIHAFSGRRSLRLAFGLGPLAVVLSGCGGSGGSGGPEVVTASLPLLQSDVAAFVGGQSFTSTARFLQVSGSTATAFPETIGVRATGGGNLILTIGGSDFTLTRDAATGRYVYTAPSGSVAIVEAALSDHVGTLLLVVEDPGFPNPTFSGGFLLVGNPSTDVGGQRGRAVYIGPSAYLAVTDGGEVNGGSGGFLFSADFDSRTVDGRIALRDAPTGTDFTLDFTGAPISGGGFATSNLQQSGLNGTVSASQLNAAFYGPGAAQVGGTYTMDLASGAGNTALAGVLLGNRQSFDLDDLAAAAAAAQNGQSSINVGGETIVLGSGSVVGGSGSVYPGGASTYYNSNTGVSFGADGGGCYYVGDWSNC